MSYQNGDVQQQQMQAVEAQSASPVRLRRVQVAYVRISPNDRVQVWRTEDSQSRNIGEPVSAVRTRVDEDRTLIVPEHIAGPQIPVHAGRCCAVIELPESNR